MLLVLGEELNNKPDDFFAHEISAIENMATAANEGKHILIGRRDLFERLSNLSFISSRSSASYKKCKEQLPEYANLKSITSDYIQVIPDGNDTINIVDGQRIINIPLGRFTDTSMIQESVLLCENLIDCDFYQIVAKVYALKKKLGTLKMRYEGRLGGGSTIVDVYQQTQGENKRLCLCIADSDKKFPTSDFGEIIKRLERIDDKAKPLSKYIPLLCREAENMLSYKQLELACSMDESRLKALQSLNNIEKCNDEERLYIDIKKGLKLAGVFKLAIDNPCRNYWNNFLSSFCRANVYNNNPCLRKNNYHINEHNCELKEEDDSCECTIMPGFGDNIFENVVMELKRNSGQKVAEMLSSSVSDEWMRVGHIVFSWCIGRGRRSVL
jgi:hypothetical protein